MDQNKRSQIAGQSAQRPDYSHAIETAYRNYLFRSRLEAKWAVFFDLCGWPWRYEPMDFNGWIPDFAIGEWPTLVEVKPFFREDQWVEAKQKIVASGCKEPVLLLGNDPLGDLHDFEPCDGPEVGYLFELVNGIHQSIELNFGITEGNDKLGLCPMQGGWTNYIWNPPPNETSANKWSRVSLEKHQVEMLLVNKWAGACNASRWVKRES